MSSPLSIYVEQYCKKTKTDKHMLVVFIPTRHTGLWYFFWGFSQLWINLPTQRWRFRPGLFVSDKRLLFPTSTLSEIRELWNWIAYVTARRTRVPASRCEMTQKSVYTHRQGQLSGTICRRSYKELSFRPDLPIYEGFLEWTNVSGLQQSRKIHELWRTVPTRGMKNTQSLPATSRDYGPITRQENSLMVIRPNMCARDTGFPQLCAVPHKNGFEPKNSQEIYNAIYPLMQACTKNVCVLAPSSPWQCLKEWRVINVLEQAVVKPCVLLIRSFSVDRAKAACKIIYLHGDILFGILAFFTRLCCQLQSRTLYGYRILNAQYVQDVMGKKV
jgi:hypothetical protein